LGLQRLKMDADRGTRHGMSSGESRMGSFVGGLGAAWTAVTRAVSTLSSQVSNLATGLYTPPEPSVQERGLSIEEERWLRPQSPIPLQDFGIMSSRNVHCETSGDITMYSRGGQVIGSSPRLLMASEVYYPTLNEGTREQEDRHSAVGGSLYQRAARIDTEPVDRGTSLSSSGGLAGGGRPRTRSFLTCGVESVQGLGGGSGQLYSQATGTRYDDLVGPGLKLADRERQSTGEPRFYHKTMTFNS
jgi:hypothetical protein